VSAGTHSTAAPLPRTRLRPGIRVLLVVAVTLVLAAAAFWAARTIASSPPAAQVPVATPPASPQIEAAYGIRISRLSITAATGLVDLRFYVLDPAKATPLLGHHGSKVPILLRLPGRHLVLDTKAMTPGESNLRAGSVYYMLFRNSAGSVHEGDDVDVIVGRYVLRHVRVL
jgi:hypothetical protein